MANELLQAVQGTPFDLKTLDTTFAAVADRNLKLQQLQIGAQKANQDAALRMAGMDLREQALALRTTQAAVAAQGQGLLNQIRQAELEKSAYAIQDATEYNQAVSEATVDGKPLAFRLRSNDPAEAEAAYKTFTQIQDRFRASPSPIVLKDLKSLESLPYVQAKQRIAEQRASTAAESVALRGELGKARLDLQGDILDETIRHRGVTEAQTDEKIKTGKENAETRRISATNRTGSGSTGQNGITVGNGKFLTYEQIRRTLGRAAMPGSTDAEKTDAETLRSQITSLKDPVSFEQRFGDKTLDAMTLQGVNLLKADTAKPATPAPSTTPSRRSPVEPALPTQDGASNSAPDPTLTPENPPASNVDSFLKKYGIPRKQKAASNDDAVSGDIMSATQQFLAQQGIVPAANAEALGLGSLLGG